MLGLFLLGSAGNRGVEKRDERDGDSVRTAETRPDATEHSGEIAVFSISAKLEGWLRDAICSSKKGPFGYTFFPFSRRPPWRFAGGVGEHDADRAVLFSVQDLVFH